MSYSISHPPPSAPPHPKQPPLALPHPPSAPPYAIPVTDFSQPPSYASVTESTQTTNSFHSSDEHQNQERPQNRIVNSKSEKDIISESYYNLFDLNKTKMKRKILYCKMCGFQYIPDIIRVDDHNYFFCIECQESLQSKLNKKTSFCCLM